MQIHELNTLSVKPGGTDYLPIDTGFDTAKISAPELLEPKVSRPLDEFGQYDNGSAGQLLRSKGDGTTEWTDLGNPTDAQTAQAVNDWLDAHLGATTTVQDGSLTEVKFSAALQLKTLKDYVTPQMFGAVGDGVADDTQPIQDAIDSGYDVLIPYGTYKTTGTINIARTIQLVALGTINYTGNDYAFNIYDQMYSRYSFARINATMGGGLHIQATNALMSECRFDIGYIEAHTNCIELSSHNTYGVQYIDFFIQMLRAIDKCIYINSTSGNWVGEIKTFGGLLTNNGEQGYGLYCSGNETTAVRMFGTGFENLGYAMYLQNAGELSFYGCRFEDVDNVDGRAFILVDRVNNFLCEGDIIYSNMVDISSLTSTYHSNIVFRGIIRQAGGVPIGEEYVIPPTLIPFTRNNYSEFVYTRYHESDADKVIGSTGIFPMFLQIKANMSLSPAYNLFGIRQIYVLTEASGITLKDSDGNNIFTTSHTYEFHRITWVKPPGEGFLTWVKNGWFDELIKYA